MTTTDPRPRENGFTLMAQAMDQPAACGHRYGSLRFEDGGLRCPTCGRGYPWSIPLAPHHGRTSVNWTQLSSVVHAQSRAPSLPSANGPAGSPPD